MRITAQQYQQLQKKPAAKGRAARKRMNGLEAKYARHLDYLLQTGKIAGYWFEAVNLRLADKCFYMPDFMVQMPDGTIEFHETKGHWQDDALVKIKVAAEQLPFKFVAYQHKSGMWVEREF